jgi:hypothetical protein
MNDNAQKFTALTGALLLIVASIFYAVRSNTAIESFRPQEPGLQSYVPPGYQNIPERLWQDPFDAFVAGSNRVASEAVLSSELIPRNFMLALSTSTNGGTNYYAFGVVTNSVTKGKGEKKLDRDLRDSVHDDTNKMHVLCVMLPGTQLAEDVEMRRKTRYAVETALLSSHLVPDDHIHIGASVLQLANNSAPNGQTNLQVAFEWFGFENSAIDRFLVLWLREDDFYSDTLETLYNILSFVTINHSIAEDKSIDFKLIGPVSSDMLKILGSSPLPKRCSDTSLWSNFAIYSPEATAPEINLWPGEETRSDPPLVGRSVTQRMIANALKCGDIQLKNWIATDDQLCRKLVRELANRSDGTVLNSNHVIVLVSEADTTFGRSLPRTFSNELSMAVSPSARVLNFEYLRGLDGSKPPSKQEERPAASSASDPQALIESALRTPVQRAENDAQLDYAERLGEFLASKDIELRRTNSAILAVGLFGTDVYDKLILLQALRPRLKEAIFFTTDLDARMWMPSKQTSITRNVIVASSYSVEPRIGRSSMDGTFLPFRDVYQTAEFLATRGAVLDSLRGTTHEPDSVPDNLNGRLFEIGRHGPVELKDPSGKPFSRQWIMPTFFGFTVLGLVVGFVCTIGWSNVWKIVKDEFWSWIRKKVLLIILLIILVILTVACFHYQVSKLILASFIAGLGLPMLTIILCGGFEWEKKDLVDDEIKLSPGAPARDASKDNPHIKDKMPPDRLLAYLAIAFMICTVFAVLAWGISAVPDEENGGWRDGVSIWPTEIIRIFIIVLSLGYFFGAHMRNELHYRTLWWDYMREGNYENIMREIKSSRDDDKGWNRIRNVLAGNWRVPSNSNEQENVDVRMLLAGYIKRAQSRNRYLRTLPLVASYLVLAFTCVLLVNGMPNRLCVRGYWSWMFDNGTLMLSTVSFLIALFLSLDGARLTGKLLDGIGSRPTSWPRQLLDEWSLKTGVRCGDLDGYMDVRFAVDKTRESRILMFFPFVIFFLLLFSRERYIDNWTWTPELAAVFGFNFLLAGMCWWIVRRSATKIREEALRKLGEVIKQVTGGAHHSIIRFKCPVGANCPQGMTFKYRAKNYAERLTALHKEIEDERRGAFALWIQDPTYLVLFVPTGVTGLLAFLVQYWLPHS